MSNECNDHCFYITSVVLLVPKCLLISENDTLQCCCALCTCAFSNLRIVEYS